MTGSRWYAWLRELAPEAAPGWWVVRALLLGFGAVVVVMDAGDVTEIGGGQLLVVLVGAALVPVSVGWGRRARTVGGARWPDRAASAAAVLALCVGVMSVASLPRYEFVDSGQFGPPGTLTRSDGTPVSNIFAYDLEGRPVDVFLFDQSGRPIDDAATYDFEGGFAGDVHVDAAGNPVPNLYPRPQAPTDASQFRPGPPPSIVPPVVPARTTTTTTTPPPPPGG